MAMIHSAYAQVAQDAFGTVGTAMITPFAPNGAIDYDAAQVVANYLVQQGNDMLVVSGTTGESPTTTDEEKQQLLKVVRSAVGDHVKIVAGVGTNVTSHSIELAKQAQSAGANGLLVVTPYYSKPSQDGIRAHVEMIADSTELPVMLYDIPGRSGIPMESETLIRMGEHPRVLAVKDAKGDIAASTDVMTRSDLVYYSGEDALNLPLMAAGAIGLVSVVGHVAAKDLARMVDSVHNNDLMQARHVAANLVPTVDAVMNHMPGVVAAKAALELAGIIQHRGTRLPVLPATEEQVEFLRSKLDGFINP
ncbi:MULTISPECIES: 4-hydroxy-tetrahydrodipicolinate synthase [Brevibacterium]|uniref:4-hydroxy-tetrahydrodipicolinate synthase n=1 Tax=Brevibacterium paucivorans TaxID=170994 RepID=A0A2N6VP15_9MICO|nr:MULTISPECIES: 4-hydroxy-tetrahydrodipicolinate synthase [Brevibacterium]MCG7298690.1 4-hydroxy-tetrahydrodipicolinate synthase [Brevibacterium sp. ACRRH]PMD05758.1 4-hydroxy-tetrahydrodipicolinate synthase [Brevibacterium paucivorans]